MKDNCNKVLNKNIEIIIFGATGDLAHKKLFPSISNLFKDFKYKDKFNILALGRNEETTSDFTQRFNDTIDKENREQFYSKIEYFVCDFLKKEDLEKLKIRLDKTCSSKILYLAIPPSLYEAVILNIEEVGLNKPCSNHNNFIRIVLEKPFGENLKTSKSLNKTLLSGFSENQIFRIDHYLGKEPIQNIFSFRFANNIFENLWNNNYIDNIQIKVSEDIGIETRGFFYEQTGALVDVFQNHILQMLSVLTMDTPYLFEEKYIRKEKNNILKKLTFSDVIKGQYIGYKEENNVSPDSLTETYIALKLEIKNSRWRNVPIYIETGKFLKEKKTEISVVFKKGNNNLFKKNGHNVLKFLIQPALGIGLTMLAKIPSIYDYEVSNINMLYNFSDYFGEVKSEYEKLLIDCIEGNQINFTRSDEIESSWILVDKIKTDIKNKKPILYKKGSLGPTERDMFLKKDNRYWIS